MMQEAKQTMKGVITGKISSHLIGRKIDDITLRTTASFLPTLDLILEEDDRDLQEGPPQFDGELLKQEYSKFMAKFRPTFDAIEEPDEVQLDIIQDESVQTVSPVKYKPAMEAIVTESGIDRYRESILERQIYFDGRPYKIEFVKFIPTLTPIQEESETTIEENVKPRKNKKNAFRRMMKFIRRKFRKVFHA